MTMRLGEILVRKRRLDERSLRRALELQSQLGGRLATNLLEIGVVDEKTLLSEIGTQRGVRTAAEDRFVDIDSDVIRLLPRKLAQRYSIVPFALKGRTLLIAGMDPVPAINEDEIGFLTSYSVRSHIALELRVELALAEHYKVPTSARFGILVKRLALSRSASRDGDRRAKAAAEESNALDASGSGVTAGSKATGSRRSRIPESLTEDGARRLAARKQAKKVESKPRFIELDDEDLAMLATEGTPSAEQQEPAAAAETPTEEASTVTVQPDPAAEPARPKSSRSRLSDATAALVACEIRDEISDAILDFCGTVFDRSILLIKRRDHIVGWHGSGAGVHGTTLQGFELEAIAPSVFRDLSEAGAKWHGVLPPLPANRAFEAMLGDRKIEECVVLPIAVRGKVVAYFFGDAPHEEVPLEELERLMHKAGLAFEVYILKNKLRLL